MTFFKQINSVFTLLILLFAYANCRVVFKDNFNGNPKSLSLPPDEQTWGYYSAFPPASFENVTSHGSSFSFDSDNGQINFVQGGFVNNVPLSILKSTVVLKDSNNPSGFKEFVIEPGQTIRYTVKLQVSGTSRSNNLTIDDYDPRRGMVAIIFGEFVLGQSICFMINRDEIFLLQDSSGPLLGLPYRNWIAWDKLADKTADEIVELSAEYDSCGNMMRWYINGEMTKEHAVGTPAGFVGKSYNITGSPGIDFPTPIPQLNNFVFGLGTIIDHDLQRRGESCAPLRLADETAYFFPTCFNKDTYECYTDSSMSTPFTTQNVPAYCPVFDGFDTHLTLHSTRIEIFN